MTQKLNRKEQIKEVAQNMFREKGYSATSMRDLAKEVGIEPASLYSHISSKEEILSDICFRMAHEFFDAIEEIRFEPINSEKKLRKAIEAHLEVIRNNRDASAVFLHDWRFMNKEDLTMFKSKRSTYEHHFREILREGVDLGIFREVNLKFILNTIFSAMNWTYEWYKPTDKNPGNEIAEDIFQLIFRGIKK